MNPYQTKCTQCRSLTSRSYAKKNNGRCKSCVTGTDQTRMFRCPDCSTGRITLYQKQHGYHCGTCTRQADPVGYANEVRFGTGGDY